MQPFLDPSHQDYLYKKLTREGGYNGRTMERRGRFYRTVSN